MIGVGVVFGDGGVVGVVTTGVVLGSSVDCGDINMCFLSFI